MKKNINCRKLKRFILLFIFCFSLTDPIYSQHWNATTDYSIINNPAGQWSYGRKWEAISTGFDLFTVRWGSTGWYFGNVGHGGPSIQAVPFPILWAKNNSNGLPVLRWTSPGVGNYFFQSTFIGRDSRGVNVTVYVTVNNTVVFTDQVEYYLDTAQYSSILSLNMNDKIDCIVKWNGVITAESSWTSAEVIIDLLSLCETPLNSGWNLISFDVMKYQYSPESYFQPLISSNNLQMVTGYQNQQGVFFDPNGLPFLNTLQSIIPGEGYWVKLQSAATLSVEGFYYPPDFSIDLVEGWNLIGYWLDETTTPEAAFASLISAGILEMVTGYDQGGKFFDPNGAPFMNTLTEIKNGLGYWVKVNSNTNFIFPQ
jgi:hypothetical protein